MIEERLTNCSRVHIRHFTSDDEVSATMDPTSTSVDRRIERPVVGCIQSVPHVGRAETGSPLFFNASDEAMGRLQFARPEMRYGVFERASLDTALIR